MKSLALTVAAAALVLTGCSSGSSGTDEADPADADVAFVQQMIPHHEQAVEMADLALDDDRGASAEVQALATTIEKAQQPEIDTMNGWLEEWGVDGSGHEGHDMSGMTGMMTEGDMTLLAESTGTDFDELWLAMMIDHHQGAVDMAQSVLDDGEDPEVAELAGTIVSTQEAEIADMKALLDDGARS